MPFIVAGLTIGSVFALAAVGLVLTYKTSGIFNFAHGALASAAAFGFYWLRDLHGVSWPLAAALVVLVGAPLVGLLLARIADLLAGASLAMKVVAMVGVLLAVQGGLQLLFPPGESRQVASFLPSDSFELFGTPVTVAQLITFAVGVLATAGLTVFLRRSRTGLAMRAVVDDTELLDSMGVAPQRVRRTAWIIGSMMAGASGVLLAPLLPLDATSITFLVVTAFGAAAIGGFSSLPLTYAGGLAIGVGQSLLQKYFVDATGIAGGLASSLPFLVLFGLLVFAPRVRRPSAAEFLRRATRPAWTAPSSVRLAGALVLLGVLVAVPSFGADQMLAWTRFLAYVVLFLALGLLVRTSGQVSLAHVSFMAIGVAAFSHLAVDQGWSWPAALLAAAAIAAPIGALLAVPAIRFPGLYLALATLGFGIALQQMFYAQDFMFGAGAGLTVPRPELAGVSFEGDTGFYYFTLAVTAIVALLVVGITRSRLGRLLRAMSDSPTGLAASGASVNVSRVLVFCLSASIGAVAGVLDGAAQTLVGGDQYQPILSLQLFAVLMIAVGGVPWYAVMAAFGMVVAPAYISTDPSVTYAFMLLFGCSAIAFAVMPPDAGTAPMWLRPLVDRLAVRWPSRRRPPAIPTAAPAPLPAAAAAGGTGLRVEDLTVRFGGLVAVDGVTLDARPGTITGLIGPNGAGKSTVFGACSGLVNRSGGQVLLDDRLLSRFGPAVRARRGLGRTFQQMELFDSGTVRDNVALGCEAGFAGFNPLAHLIASRRQRRLVRQRTDEALAMCGLGELADRQVASLATGQRRMVELARCAAGRYEILLLDEPSSGLDKVETERFGRILTEIVEQRGVGILLVEHDMSLITSICDEVHVLDFGTKIAAGSVGEVVASAAVQAAYLGHSSDAFGPQPEGTRS
nr:ATP-binding cassette domain-containing protein [Conexibacter woesei]